MKDVIFKINKLGPVSESSVTLKPMTIISGESGIGKSYVSFLLHYFYVLLEQPRFDAFFEKINMTDEELFKEEKGVRKILTKDIEEWINEDVKDYIREGIGFSDLDVDVEIKNCFNKSEYVFSWKREYLGLAGKEMLYRAISVDNHMFRYEDETQGLGALPFRFLITTIIRQITGIKNREAFLMIPGRGAILNSQLEAYPNKMVAEFVRDWNAIKVRPGRKMSGDDIILKKMIDRINGGDIRVLNGLVSLVLDDVPNPVPIQATASSIKELAPMALLVEKCPVSDLSIMFEEPEAHLHPWKQVEIADFVAKAFNMGAHFQITTHSEYFIRRLNDFMTLHQLKKVDQQLYSQAKEKYQYPDITIDSSDVVAYLLKKNDSTGNVTVEAQEITDGVPFESFYNVIKRVYLIV